MIKSTLRAALPLIDMALVIPVMISGWVMKAFRRIGAARLPWSNDCLLWVGVFPIRDHYYEPMFNPRNLRHALKDEREYLQHHRHTKLNKVCRYLTEFREPASFWLRRK